MSAPHTGATTSYAVNEPSYAYTDRTTQFDDALLQRGIVTMEQVLLSKGMSINTAEQLLLRQQKKNDDAESMIANRMVDVSSNITTDAKYDNFNVNDDDHDDSDDDEYDDDDDEFLQSYKQRRLQELQDASTHQKEERTFGDVIYINRTEWYHHVNDDSKDGIWIVIGLLSTYDTNRTKSVQHAMSILASKYTATKFIYITSHQAIEHWPEEHLPTIFIYRYGKLQYEWIQLPINITTEQLEDRLRDVSVIQ